MNDCITEGSGAKVVDRFLLLTVDPSCDYGYVELPWLKDETHDRTELVKCVVPHSPWDARFDDSTRPARCNRHPVVNSPVIRSVWLLPEGNANKVG